VMLFILHALLPEPLDPIPLPFPLVQAGMAY